MADGKLTFDTSLDAGGFKKGLLSVSNIFGGAAIFSMVSKGFQLIGQSIGAATNRYDTLTRFPTVLEKMGFSAADAERSTKKLSDGIMGLPTALDEVVGTAQRMASMTGNLEEATDVTLALNNAFLASGSTADMAKRGTEQYLQALGRGKFDMQDWKTLQETMSYGLVKIAEKFGFAGQSAQKDLYEALKSGKISMKDFNKALLECNEGIGGFAEVAKDSTKGIGTAMQNMRTSVVRGLANMIKTVNEGLSKTKFKSIENIIQTIGKGFEKALNTAGDAVNGLLANLDVVAPALTAAFSGAVIGEIVSKVMGVKKAFDAAKKATDIFAKGAVVAEKSLKDLSIAQQFAAGAGQAAAAGVGKFSAGLAGLKTVMIAHPAMTFALALGAIVGAAVLVTRAIQGMHDQAHPALSNLKEKTKELKKANEDLVASTDKVIKREEANIALAREKEQSVAKSIDKLDKLIQKNDRSADSNKEIQKTVKELNNAYGDLNLTWDETNATLNHSIDQLREYNSVMRKTAEAEAYGKIYSDLMQEVAEKTLDLEAAQKALGDTYKENAGKVEQYVGRGQVLGLTETENAKTIRKAKEDIKDAEESLEKVKERALDAARKKSELMAELENSSAIKQIEANNKIRESTKITVDSVINGFKEIPTAMDISTREAWEIMKKNLAAQKEHADLVAKMTAMFGQEFAAGFSALGPQANQIMKDFLNGAISVEEIRTFAQEVGITLPEGFGQGILDGKPVVDEAVDQATSGFPEAAKEKAEQAKGAADPVLATLAGLFGGAAASAASSFMFNLNPLPGQAGGKTKEASASAANGLASNAGRVPSISNLFKSGFMTPLKDLTGQTYGEGSRASGNYVRGLDSNRGKAASTASDISGGVKSNLNVSGTYKIGSDASQGLIDGLNSKLQAVAKAASAVAAAVVPAMRLTLQQRSPSRVTRKIGAFTTEGLILGLKDKAKEVEKVSKMLASTVSDNLQIDPGVLQSKVLAQSGFSVPVGASAAFSGAGGPASVHFEQTINSPKYLSPSEVSRETRDLLARSKHLIP